MTTDWGPDRALYGISVAAELTGVNPQMLRTYEARGLLEPQRTGGGTRRYSGADLALVNRITTLLAAGLNLAGVDHVLQLEAENRRLRAELDALRSGRGQQAPQQRRERNRKEG
jgi:MerR family transcriptional regulator, heat shock protein HspR